MKRKVCVITGTRAEYGLLRRVMQGIKDEKDLELQIIASVCIFHQNLVLL